MTDRRKLTPTSDKVVDFLKTQPGATVVEIGLALFPDRARNGVATAQSCLDTLHRTGRVSRFKIKKTHKHFFRYYNRGEKPALHQIGVSLSTYPKPHNSSGEHE
jgi:hypothetical protein